MEFTNHMHHQVLLKMTINCSQKEFKHSRGSWWICFEGRDSSKSCQFPVAEKAVAGNSELAADEDRQTQADVLRKENSNERNVQ